jgi:hypothetical protein
MIDNGVSKKRHNSREGSAPPPLKKIKKEREEDYFPSCNNESSRNESVVHELHLEDCGLIVSDGTEHNESSSYNKSSVLILIPSISIS